MTEKQPITPERIQLSRKKGWRKPENTVVVARPTKWGNPYKWSELLDDGHSPDMARQVSVEQFEDSLAMGDHPDYPDGAMIRAELAGKNLACWCPLVDADGIPVPCHADVLLEIANGEPS